MAVNRTKILREAERFTQQGRIEQAIGRYQQLMKGHPRDVSTVNKIGDLYARIGKIPDAVKQFLTTAEFYASDGFFLKAIAIYKKVTKLDPGNTRAFLKLGELYNQQGLPFEAKAQFQTVAEKLATGGDHDQAIEVYQKILQMDSSNMRVRVQIADLESRQGNFDAALQMYRELGEELRKKGKTDECQRVLEKALEVQPGHGGIARSLAQLFFEKGEVPQALSLAKKVAEAKPGDGDAVALLAETYLKAGRTADAEKILSQVPAEVIQECPELQATMGRLELAQGRVEKAEAPIEKAADLWKNQGKPNEAIPLLLEILEADPMRTGALRRLKEFRKEGGDPELLKEVSFRLAEALEKRGMVPEAIRELEELKESYPNDDGIGSRLESLKNRKDEPIAAPPPAEEVVREDPSAADPDAAKAIEVEVTGEGLADNAASVSGEVESTIEIAGEDYEGFAEDSEDVVLDSQEEEGAERDDEQEDAIQELLTEAEVFTKYRLIEKAEERLQKIVKKYPSHIAALEKLKELYFEEGDKEKSVLQCLQLAKVFRKKGDNDRAVEFLEEAEKIDPNNQKIQNSLQELRPATPAGERKRGTRDSAAASPVPSETIPPASHEKYQDMTDEVDIEWGDDSPEIALEETDQVESGDPVDAASAKREEVIEVVDPPPASEPAKPVKPSPPSREKLREVDFFLEQELWDEAESILKGLGPRENCHPDLFQRWEELEAGKKPEADAPGSEIDFSDIGDEVDRALGGQLTTPPKAPPPPPAAPAAKPADPAKVADFFDLATELEKEIREVEEEEAEADEEELLKGINVAEEGEHSLEEVFQAFKKGVEEQIDSGDFDTHYQLGIAYKEMGLIDEAIGEFQYAAKDHGHFMDCCSILGMCFKEKGMVPMAEKWYRKALETTGFSEDEYLGVRYDLATLLRESGEKKEALELFTEVYGINTKYRDVSEQIKKLSKQAKSN